MLLSLYVKSMIIWLSASSTVSRTARSSPHHQHQDSNFSLLLIWVMLKIQNPWWINQTKISCFFFFPCQQKITYNRFLSTSFWRKIFFPFQKSYKYEFFKIRRWLRCWAFWLKKIYIKAQRHILPLTSIKHIPSRDEKYGLIN